MSRDPLRLVFVLGLISFVCAARRRRAARREAARNVEDRLRLWHGEEGRNRRNAVESMGLSDSDSDDDAQVRVQVKRTRTRGKKRGKDSGRAKRQEEASAV